MNVSNYSPCKQQFFKSLTSYFINIYYNHLYSHALDLYNKKKVDSITDGYKQSIDAFLQYYSTDKKKLIQNIYNTFNEDYNLDYKTFSDFREILFSIFIPENVNEKITKENKYKLFINSMYNINKKFCFMLIKNNLSLVVDDRNKKNAIYLQNEYLNFICLEVSEIHDRFKYNKYEEPNMNAVMKLQQKNNSMNKNYDKLKETITELKNTIESFRVNVKKKNDFIKKQNNIIKTLNKEIITKNIVIKKLSERIKNNGDNNSVSSYENNNSHKDEDKVVDKDFEEINYNDKDDDNGFVEISDNKSIDNDNTEVSQNYECFDEDFEY